VNCVSIKCSKCGEELLGAVNRCWRCGQIFAATPQQTGTEVPSSPADIADEQAIGAVLVGDAASKGPALVPFAEKEIRRLTTAELIDARRAGLMAMGGTVTSLVLGIFASILATFWPPAALVAVLGLAMGLWGLSSPRRNLALLGMLLCSLAIGIGTYGIARSISIAMQKNKTVLEEDAPAIGNN
jgi:hypothetical protein